MVCLYMALGTARHSLRRKRKGGEGGQLIQQSQPSTRRRGKPSKHECISHGYLRRQIKKAESKGKVYVQKIQTCDNARADHLFINNKGGKRSMDGDYCARQKDGIKRCIKRIEYHDKIKQARDLRKKERDEKLRPIREAKKEEARKRRELKKADTVRRNELKRQERVKEIQANKTRRKENTLRRQAERKNANIIEKTRRRE